MEEGKPLFNNYISNNIEEMTFYATYSLSIERTAHTKFKYQN